MLRFVALAAFVLLAACSTPRAQDSAQPQAPSGQVKGQPDIPLQSAQRIPPVPPVGVHAIKDGAKAIVSWKPSRLDAILGYSVYRKVGTGKYEWLGQVKEPTFVDPKPPKGAVSYSVTVKSAAGVESPLSEPAKPMPKTSTGK